MKQDGDTDILSADGASAFCRLSAGDMLSPVWRTGCPPDTAFNMNALHLKHGIRNRQEAYSPGSGGFVLLHPFPALRGVAEEDAGHVADADAAAAALFLFGDDDQLVT